MSKENSPEITKVEDVQDSPPVLETSAPTRQSWRETPPRHTRPPAECAECAECTGEPCPIKMENLVFLKRQVDAGASSSTTSVSGEAELEEGEIAESESSEDDPTAAQDPQPTSGDPMTTLVEETIILMLELRAGLKAQTESAKDSARAWRNFAAGDMDIMYQTAFAVCFIVVPVLWATSLHL
jgi:hypothetical protein